MRILTGRSAGCFCSQNVICPDPTAPCQNGGHISAGVCLCPEYTSGAHCELYTCLHGGYYDKSISACRCVDAHDGAHCELGMAKVDYAHTECCAVRCSSTNIKPDFNMFGRSLGLVIQTTLDASYDLQQVQKSVQTLVNATGSPASVTRWTVVSFDNTGTRLCHPCTSTID
jgi:hypothetical protein